MEHEINITLRFDLATGKVNLNEIVYRLKELQSPLMLEILKHILMGYDDIILVIYRWRRGRFLEPVRGRICHEQR